MNDRIDPDRQQLLADLSRLPADEAVVMRLKLFDGLTFDEIGTKLAVSRNAVKARYYRELSAMRAHLRSKGQES